MKLTITNISEKHLREVLKIYNYYKFGKLDFEKLFATAIHYASEGFPVHEIEAFHWKKNEDKLKKNKVTKEIFLNNNKAPIFGKKFSNNQYNDVFGRV